MITRKIEAYLAHHTTTVRELIEQLEMFDDDLPVVFHTDYGDITHTQQIHGIDTFDEIPITALVETAYSKSGIAVDLGCDQDPHEDTFLLLG